LSTTPVHKSSFVRSAWVVAMGTAFSRVSGLVREQVMAYYFGAGMATDAYVTAFRIPNLLRDLFAEGALSSSFVPVFKEKLVNKSEDEAFHLANVVVTAMLLVLGVVTLLGIVGTKAIIFLTATGFADNKEKFDLTVNLTQIMWPFLPLVSISALVMGMLNSFERFGLPALAPAMFNVGSVLTVVILYRFFDAPIYTMAIGVLVGGFGQIAVQIPTLRNIGYRFRFRLQLFDEGLRKMVRMFTPMMIGLSAGRINILLSTLLVSFLSEGSMSYLNYAFRLMHFPLGVFGVALGTVALPRATEIASRGDMEGLGKTYREALNMSLMLMIPSALALALLGHQFVSVVYRYGAFSSEHASNTALALLHYSYGIIGMGAVRVTAPVYYALGDAKLPMRASIISVVVNMLLYYPLIKTMDFAGVAAATSLASLVNFGILLYFLPTKGVPFHFGDFFMKLIRIVLAASLAWTAARFLPMEWVSGTGIWAKIQFAVIPLILGCGLYIGFCYALGIAEMKQLMRAIFRRRG
jgi:putative peptidoglycan lipid II flippase